MHRRQARFLVAAIIGTRTCYCGLVVVVELVVVPPLAGSVSVFLPRSSRVTDVFEQLGLAGANPRPGLKNDADPHLRHVASLPRATVRSAAIFWAARPRALLA
jgi:hypothetical protein